MKTFKKFLEKSRKANGEKYLIKSILLYTNIIEKNYDKFSEFDGNIDELIVYMNTLIKNQHNPYLRASFKLYLIFLGVDEDDDKLKLLKSTKKRASALTSLRVLGDKVIPMKDLKLLYGGVDDEWRLVIGFLYDTAVRENELLSLRWKDITFYENDENDETNIFAEVRVLGKGSKFRTAFLSNNTCKLLKKLRPDIDEEDLVFVFKMRSGKLYERQDKAVLDGIKKRTKNILGKTYTVHCFRHTKLTHLSENGGDIVGISSIAGHSSISTTNIYVKGGKKEAVKTYQKFTESL